jgi:hypothetical protein
MDKLIKIGTRESQLAVWQATHVQQLLSKNGYPSELIYIKSEGDLDLQTPLYEMGVQGIFTKSLDTALLNNTIDIAVHSMKDVPTQLATGIIQSAVLKRASYKDIFVFKDPSVVAEWKLSEDSLITKLETAGIIATSSIRRKAQWLNRYPNHTIENLRGNVNTRLRKVQENNWKGGGFFKYYYLEQYEQSLKNVKYLDGDIFTMPDKSPYNSYVFMKDEKMLHGFEIDYKNNKVKVKLDKFYEEIDIAETLSNLSGKWIKKINVDNVEFEDGEKIDLKDLDYRLIKPLVWWI